MKTLQEITNLSGHAPDASGLMPNNTFLAILLGAKDPALAQSSDSVANPMEKARHTHDDDDRGKLGLAGLLVLLGLLGMRRNRVGHIRTGGSNK